MTETEYPWRTRPYNTVDEIMIGDVIPQIQDSKGKCPNCQNDDGALYVRQVVAHGPLHWFTDKEGGIRRMFATLYSLPCGVCRPHRAPPKEPEEKERRVYWDD